MSFLPEYYGSYQFFPDIDECLSVSCLNGGTCINLQGGFMCECPPGFRGDTCGIGKYIRVKMFRIIPEFRILRPTFCGKSASKY